MSNAEVTDGVVELNPAEPQCADGARVEILTSREVPLGGPRAMGVSRTIPQRKRSFVGAWCFADHFGPDDVASTGGMDVAPHPHTGLQTVSWLFEGEITHHDSGGNHAVVIPGEVNLMTAGSGIAHSEVSTSSTTRLHGVQLWTALPDSVRHTERKFENYAPPRTQLDGGSALVFLGSLMGASSPVSTYTPIVGAELSIDPQSTVELTVNPEFEHGLLVDEGDVDLEGVTIQPREMGYCGVGEERLRIRNNGSTQARIIFLGGEPFKEEIVMWWNFIGRDHDEIAAFREDWEAQAERFGSVHGYIAHHVDSPTVIPAPALPKSRMRPRKNPEPVARPDGKGESSSKDHPRGKHPFTDSKEHEMSVTTTDNQGNELYIHKTDTVFAAVYPGEEQLAALTAYTDVEETKERIFYHTEVSPDHEGKRLAGILVEQALKETEAEGLTVVPVCPYVKSWVEKHAWTGPWRTPQSKHLDAVDKAVNNE